MSNSQKYLIRKKICPYCRKKYTLGAIKKHIEICKQKEMTK